MKTFIKTLFLVTVLLLVLQANISAGSGALDVAKTKCCFDVPDIRIPLKRLKSYYWTSSTCPLKHIVFITIVEKHICVNPESKWAKTAIKHVDKKRGKK